MGDLFIYNFLRLILVATLLISGMHISKSKNSKNIGLCIAVAVIAFSLIEGLRWNRGPDYYNNYLFLSNINSQIKHSEPFFNFIVHLLRDWLLVPYWACFIFFSFLYILSYMKVITLFPKTALWALPIMFLATYAAHENIIRQFIGISFVLFAFYYYIKEKKNISILFLIFAFNTHYSALFAVAIFAFIAFVKPEKYVDKPIYLLLIYIALYFFWDSSYFNYVSIYLGSLDVSGITGDEMQGYLDNSDRWLTTEGALIASKEASILNKVSQLVCNSIIVYFGFRTIKYDERLSIPYWFTYFAIIIMTMAGQIEIYNRFAWWLYYFMPIVLGAIWYLVPLNRNIKLAMSCFIIFVYAYNFFAGFPKMPTTGCAFVWDR